MSGPLQDAVMASGFCDDCSKLLREFTDHLMRFWKELELKIKEVFREVGRCNCFTISPGGKTSSDLPSLHFICGRNIAATRYCLCGHICREEKTVADYIILKYYNASK